MKSFCILEQGCHINEPLTLKKKALFTTEFSDFYRLNWQNPDNDPNSFIKDDFIKEKKLIWSEGRSILYERVPKQYDYYVFVDDDMEFYADNIQDVALKIKSFLDEYKPITGTFYDPKQWNFYHSGIDQKVCISRKVFPIAGYDQQIQFFSKRFADLMFPTIYHGGGGSMWYSQWLCYKLFPLKQVCFSEIQVSNTRHQSDSSNPGGGYGRTEFQFYNVGESIWLLNRYVNDKSFLSWNKEKILNQNRSIFNKEVDQTEIEVTLDDIKKVYDINNPDYLNRIAVADKSYMRRRYWNNLLWTWAMKLESWQKKLKINVIRGM